MFLLLQFGAHRCLKCRVVLTEPARGRKPDPMPFHLLFEPVVVGTCSCSPLLRPCFLCLTRAHVLLGFPFFASSVSSGQSPTSPLFMRVRLHLPYFSLLFCSVVTSLVMLLFFFSFFSCVSVLCTSSSSPATVVRVRCAVRHCLISHFSSNDLLVFFFFFLFLFGQLDVPVYLLDAQPRVRCPSARNREDEDSREDVFA